MHQFLRNFPVQLVGCTYTLPQKYRVEFTRVDNYTFEMKVSDFRLDQQATHDWVECYRQLVTTAEAHLISCWLLGYQLSSLDLNYIKLMLSSHTPTGVELCQGVTAARIRTGVDSELRPAPSQSIMAATPGDSAD